ncbi:MAG: CHAD domain-containing protein [Singulisphaera sp.]
MRVIDAHDAAAPSELRSSAASWTPDGPGGWVELQWLAGGLGGVRDLDVLRGGFKPHRENSPTHRGTLHHAEGRRRRTIQDMLQDERWRRVTDGLSEAWTGPIGS